MVRLWSCSAPAGDLSASSHLVVANRCEPINVALISSFFGLQPLCIKRQKLLFLKCRVALGGAKALRSERFPLPGAHKKTGSSEPVYHRGYWVQ